MMTSEILTTMATRLTQEREAALTRDAREYALAHDWRVQIEWTGIGHTPWRVEFRTHTGRQVGHGIGKNASTALWRAMEDAEGRDA